MTMITPSYLGETIEYSSLHACRSTLEDPTPLAHYHLAQAYERKGERQEARTAYEQFLQNWRYADAGVPEVVKAKRELLAFSAKSR